MPVSFILPAHNEERLVGRAVSSIRHAADELKLDYEIVVANDASTDRTSEIAAACGARVVTGEARQIAATRNLGARAATGDRLIFVDADSAVTTELVRQTIKVFDEGCAGGGSRCAFDGEIPTWAKIIARLVLPLYARAGLTPGAYIFATRDAFDAVGGFDESLFGGEEVFMARALRKQGRFVIVGAAVLTSGRKLRAHSGREIGGVLVRLMLKGRKGVMQRDGLGLWYDPRSDDPGCPESANS